MSIQDVPTTQAVNGQQQPSIPSWTFTFSIQDWVTIRSGLLELPGKHGIPVLQKLEAMFAQAQATQGVVQ